MAFSTYSQAGAGTPRDNLAERMRIRYDGRVGIGITTPAATLDIKGSIQANLPDPTSSLESGNRTIGSTGHGLLAGDAVSIPSGASGAIEKFTVDSVTNSNYFVVDSDLSNSVTNVQMFKDQDLLKIQTGDGQSKVIVNKSGNVGIGTAAPTTKLVVANNSATSDASAISIISGNAASSYLNFGDAEDDNRGMIQYVQSSDVMYFRTSGSGTDVTIDSVGNVGIGNTAPLYRLDISTTETTGTANSEPPITESFRITMFSLLSK